jgi:hypothetical protein
MYYVVFATGLVWREMNDHCKVVNSVRLSSAIWDHAYQEHMADMADARSY